MEFVIESPAFESEGMISSRYTCDDEDVSPKLSWTGPPAGSRSFALICDDPDAPMGTWVHWVVYNIPADINALPEALPPQERFADGMLQGKNDFGRSGYDGPCPPGGTHRYYFKLYALDSLLDMEPGADKETLLKAMEGHVLGKAVLMGRYSRQK
jgi:Raf kinase inhibitor-like YbhB/YbcL family protein